MDREQCFPNCQRALKLMIKFYKRFTQLVILAIPLLGQAASWEKLYCMNSTDCFRSVREVSSGGYVLAGYTANFSPNDTDGLVLRLNANGDTLWTLVYDGPNHKDDCFYKILSISGGGYIICGYSKSFGHGENAIFMKISSNGHVQWVTDWGGSGIERAQDIRQLPNGNFIACGYTTSSPGQYYDAFIMELSSGGNINWVKTYGATGYDDANSIRVLPDGYIAGGQSSSQLYLIRTNLSGDTMWTKKFGTSGVDNIECINFAQGGSGYILAGSTDGSGFGDDAYLVRVDSGGNQLWAKKIGGNDNDDFHHIEQTSDGGYVAFGTSIQGPWGDPNIWIAKLDVNGNLSWQKFYGGDNHDHGYSGQQTSDGGYIVAGHSHSFADDRYNEDALVIKTNSSGNVSDKLTFTAVTDLISPASSVCGSAATTIKVEVSNYGDETVSSVPVTIEITGDTILTLTQTLNSSLDINETKSLTFTTTLNTTSGGTYNFHCVTGNPHDVIPARNYYDKTRVINTTDPPTVQDGSHCGPGSVSLNATASSSTINWYVNASGGSSISNGSNFNTPVLNNSTVYYVSAGSSCPSIRVPITASILILPNSPVTVDDEVCGSGIMLLSASASDPIKWFDSPSGGTMVGSGNTYHTPVLTQTVTYYAFADDGQCLSAGTAAMATVHPLPLISLGQDTMYSSVNSFVLDAGPGYSSYLWSTTENTQSVQVNSPGMYCVTVTDAYGCSNSDCIYVEFSVSIPEIFSNNIQVYPNPAWDYITISCEERLYGSQFIIHDISGREVFNGTLEKHTIFHLPSCMKQGIYFLRLSGPDTILQGRLVVQSGF